MFVLYASSINLTRNLDLGIGPLSLSIFNKILFRKDIPKLYNHFFKLLTNLIQKALYIDIKLKFIVYITVIYIIDTTKDINKQKKVTYYKFY